MFPNPKDSTSQKSLRSPERQVSNKQNKQTMSGVRLHFPRLRLEAVKGRLSYFSPTMYNGLLPVDQDNIRTTHSVYIFTMYKGIKIQMNILVAIYSRFYFNYEYYF